MIKKSILIRIVSITLVLIVIGNSFAFATKANTKSEAPTLENAVMKFGRALIDVDKVSITETIECFDNYGNCVVTSDLSNEDVLMWIYEADGSLLMTGLLSRSSRTLYKAVEESKSIEVVHYPDRRNNQLDSPLNHDSGANLLYSIPTGASTGARVGIDALDDYGAYMASLSIDIYGVRSYSYVPDINISNTYADFATFVGDLVLQLISTGVVITPFATHVLLCVGLAITATYFFIMNIEVTKATTTVNWFVYLVGSSSSGTVTGTSSTFTCSTISNYSNNTGYYYPIGSLRSYNTSLALACYDSIFSGANGSVSSWSNVW